MNFHIAVIKNDGTLWACGWNGNGALGDGTTISKNSPVQIGSEANWSQVAIGTSNTLAIKSDGTLWAWGWNDNGELGDGTTTQRITPIQIGTETKWKKITCGEDYSVAFKNMMCNKLTSSPLSISFGDRTCLPDTTITITLNNPMDLTVSVSQTIFYNGTNSKLLITNGGAFSITSNDSRQISLKLKPNSTGIIEDTLLISIIDGCDLYLKIPITGIRDTLDFAVLTTDTIDMGKTCPKTSIDTLIYIKNKSSKATSFIRNNIDNPFTLTGTDPFATIFALNEIKDLHLRFMSPDTGIFYQNLVITDTCGKTKKIVLKAEIHVPQADAGPDQTICAGDTINIGKSITKRNTSL